MAQLSMKYSDNDAPQFPARVALYPQLRYMGSKYRLLPWIHDVLSTLPFNSALDAFSGSGCVSYLLKSMGAEVVSNDFLNFSHRIVTASVENSGLTLSSDDLEILTTSSSDRPNFIAKTFTGIFFTPADLTFLDLIWSNLHRLENQWKEALVISALVRSCVKRQPRGVFTISGDPGIYDDGRRDLRLSLEEHFLESIVKYNAVVFDNGRNNRAIQGDVFEVDAKVDLVYMDPPYVPRSDDNCYVKRYHFLEGLATYWQGVEIMESTKVKKIQKKYTPFSYRRTALEAFDRMFRKFSDSILVLSYSSNGYPDLATLCELMKKYKRHVDVFEKSHRYHFGTHSGVNRAEVKEYLVVGTE